MLSRILAQQFICRRLRCSILENRYEIRYIKYKKRKIVIIQCISSSVNYISDIRDMGFEPVLMELGVPESRIEFDRKWHDDYYSLNGDILPDIFRESEKYEDNLELMKKLDTLLIIPGSDRALEIAMQLSADLGLPGNSFKNIRAMQNKYYMQDDLKKRD